MVSDSLLQFSVTPKPTLCRLINSIIQLCKWVLSVQKKEVSDNPGLVDFAIGRG